VANQTLVKRSYISKLIALFVGFLCLVIAYNHNSSSTYIFKGEAYGTTWTLTTTKYLNDSHKIAIKDIIKKIDYVASNYKEDSEIAKINSSPNSTDIKVSNDLFKILEIANNISALTNNSYDIKLGKYSSSLGFSPTFNKTYLHMAHHFFCLIKLIKH
jgi:thiamine biosynthesis lipoprotein ApbE